MVAMTPQGAKKGGKLVDREGVLTLVRKVSSARHMIRFPEESWAVDAEVLREAEAEGVERVEVRDERGRVWWTGLRHLLERGHELDRGFGRQVRLPLRLWSFRPARPDPREQRALFAEFAP